MADEFSRNRAPGHGETGPFGERPLESPALANLRAPARSRPDPRPGRLVLGVSGLVTATALVTAVVHGHGAGVTSSGQSAPPLPSVQPQPTTQPAPIAAQPPQVVRHVTHYVQLHPGESAPAGAKVVTKPDPSPRVVVIAAPTQPPTARPRPPVQSQPKPQPQPPRIVVVTRQSGTP